MQQRQTDATVQLDFLASIQHMTFHDTAECSRGVPEIQEVLSLNQAQTRDWRLNDRQKTVEISEFMEKLARGIWIAFMSTGGT